MLYVKNKESIGLLIPVGTRILGNVDDAFNGSNKSGSA